MSHPPQRNNNYDIALACVALIAALCLYWLIGRLP